MTKDKSKKKKKKEQSKGKEEEDGEGIPLKTTNEFRRANRMEPFTKEQYEKIRAVIRANNSKLEKQLEQIKGAQTQSHLSDKTERSNLQSSPNTQLPSGENAVSAQEAEKVEEEIAKNFQQIANLEYYGKRRFFQVIYRHGRRSKPR